MQPIFRPIVRSFTRTTLIASLCVSMLASAKEEQLPLTGKTRPLSFMVDNASWVSVAMLPGKDAFVFDLLGDLYELPLHGGDALLISGGLGFDSQPAVSPDGTWIAFISDRDGADNLWIMRPDGSEPRKLSDEQYNPLLSPAWSPDGRFVTVTRDAADIELVTFHVDGGSGVIVKAANAEDLPAVGAAYSPDGRYIYYAAAAGSNGPVDNFPATQIFRVRLRDGVTEQITRGEGGGFKPLLSPDGTLLVYGTRYERDTELRIRSLVTGEDQRLTLPVQHDSQDNFRPSSRGMLPGYTFTDDGQSVVLSAGGKFQKVSLQAGTRETIPFVADVTLAVGPDLTRHWRVPDGPVTAVLAQDPALSKDKNQIVASVLTRLYLLDLDTDVAPRPITPASMWAFKPAWSPDGRWIAFVTWTANDGGHIWRIRSNGRGKPQQLTRHAAFYTDVSFSPDGEQLYALRGNEWMRHQTFSEFTGLGIPLEVISLDSSGGDVRVVMPAGTARYPHFGPETDRLYLYDEDALFSVALDGSDRRDLLVVEAPSGNRNPKEPPKAEQVRISPVGGHAIALVNKQVWVIPLVPAGGNVPTVSVRGPALPAVQLTDTGADFLDWSNDGSEIYWTIGSTVHRRPLDSIVFFEPADDEEEALEHAEGHGTKEQDQNDETANTEAPVPRLEDDEAVVSLQFEVVLPRNNPIGRLLLQGGNVIAMAGSTTAQMTAVLNNYDILIEGNRIVATGITGSLEVPMGTTVINVAGKYLVPGFIDTHAHWELRTGDVLEPTNWSLIANLAYGVTSGLDVQTSYHDYFAYRDLVATGQSIGQRAFMTGPGIFGNNDFESYEAVKNYLRRYSDHYRTPNIKSYLVGNRKQRQWVVLASQELGLMPTTEGGGDQKLNLTHAIDGMHGNEHNMPDMPFFDDVIALYAKTQTAYTPTLIVQYNAESAREYYFTRTEVHDDAKLARFYPHNRLDELTQRRPGWMRDEMYRFAEGAAAAAAIARAGGLVGVGGHAELQGLGYHWEMQSYVAGGMTPAEVLRAATIDGARILGAPDDLGSIEPGKLADLVVLDANPLDDIRHTTAIGRVVQNGRVYDGNTLDQQYPRVKPLPPFWWWEKDDTHNVPGAAN